MSTNRAFQHRLTSESLRAGAFKAIGTIWLAIICLLWGMTANGQAPVPATSVSASAEASVGVPQDQWTDEEKKAIAQLKDQYTRSGMQLTDAQAALTVQRMRDVKARVFGALAVNRAAVASMAAAPTAMMPPAIPTAVQPALVGEAAIGQSVNALGTTGGPWTITDRREGFVVNGRPYLDPEGAIAVYSADVLTGYITYAAKTPTGYVIKETRAGSADPAVVLATGQKTREGWDFTTQSGQRLTGTQFSPLPNGFLVIRGGSGFRYTPGKGVSSITAPEGYVLANLQRGNVDNTGFVLVEKDQSLKKNGIGESIGELASIFSSKGVQDYALMEIASGRMFPLSISVGGKDVTQMSNCHKKNDLINSCANMDIFESLYQTNGFRNYGHYYWRVNWFNTPAGPIAVSIGGEMGSSLIVTDLRSGKQVVAKHRALGIGDWDASQQPDGDVTIVAKVGFSTETVSNASKLLTTELAGSPPTGAATNETASTGTMAPSSPSAEPAVMPAAGPAMSPAQ